MRDRIVLVTGAAGQVGKQALFEYADGEKASHIIANDVTTDFRLPASSGRVSYSIIKADLREPEELQEITNIIKSRPETEVLILAIGGLFKFTASWSDLYEVNVIGQKNLVESIALPLQNSGKRVKLVFWGAAALYGEFNNPATALPADENYPLDPKSDYAKTKQAAEDLLLAYHRRENLWVSIMRCGAIYAEGGTYGMVNAIALMILGMLEPLRVGGKNRVALVHARDTVRIADFLASQETANGKIYNVRDDSVYTLEAITKAQCAAIGIRAFNHFQMDKEIFFERVVQPAEIKAKKWGVPTTIDTNLAKMMVLNSYIDISTLKELFAKTGADFNSYLLYPDTVPGLKQTIEWYRRNWREWIAYV